jgi:hypothetical protein
MCTEFLLALLYLTVIFVINFFLFKLLINYRKNILYFIKLKNILKTYKIENLQNISFFYFYQKKNFNLRNFLVNFKKKLLNRKDILITGNFYKFLGRQLETKKTKAQIYYYKLLENQYLSMNIKE